MPGEYDNDLLKQGILHLRSKEFSLARRYFERALDAADDLQTQAQANYYMSQVVDDPQQKRQFLEETLAIDMGHAAARRALAILDGRLKPAEIVNPDNLPAAVAGTQAAQAQRFTCPRCGGRMLYTPDGSSLVCESCSRRQQLDTLTPGADQDFFVAMANGTGFRSTISAKTFQCQGCGAGFLLPTSDLSATCAYCGSMFVLAIHKEACELVEPDAIIPMAFNQEQANLHMARWVEKEHLQQQRKLEPARGLYLPVWVFDLIGSVPWSGRMLRDKREVPVSGEYPAIFNDVCVPASPNLTGLFPGLLPGYRLAAAPAYDPRFLAGWPAEVYTLAMSDAALEARHIGVDRIRHAIHAEHGNVIDLRYSASAISITSYRLILLPVWVTEYSVDDKTHRVVINGQSGAVHGEAPPHALKDLLEDLLGA
jgi:DNA-directed RNA polymerase subunit RPC12/RpoP